MSLVFLDFDHTIIHGDAGPLFGTHLFQERKKRLEKKPHGPGRAVAKTAMWSHIIPYVGWMGVQTTLYKLRAVRRSTIIRSAYKGFKGVPVARLEDALDAFVAQEIAPRIFPQIRREMEEHVAAGRRCVIITTGMQALVERVLPFLPEGTEVIGCVLEERQGKLTGNVLQGPLFGQDKANIIFAYCQASGVDPEQCYGYTDHYSDFQMLQAVGHGVCVNPRPRLAGLARKEGWRVVELPDPRLQS